MLCFFQPFGGSIKIGALFAETTAEVGITFNTIKITAVAADAAHTGDRNFVFRQNGDVHAVGNDKRVSDDAVGV